MSDIHIHDSYLLIDPLWLGVAVGVVLPALVALAAVVYLLNRGRRP